MTSIILLEGIPTCGKTIIMEKLVKLLEGNTLQVPDKETKALYLRKQDPNDTNPVESAPRYIAQLIQQKLVAKPDQIILDNGHLFYLASNNARAKHESLADYKVVEELLCQHDSLIVFIELQGRMMLPNFRHACEREKEKGSDLFEKLLAAKGNGLQQMSYYQKKQELYAKFAKASKVNWMKVDVTKESNYDELAKEIFIKVKNLSGFFSLAKE